MKTRRLPLALSIATAATLVVPDASTAALGGVRSLSAIGEPFQAEILIAEQDLQDAAACLRVAPTEGSPQWLGEARIEAVGRGAQARIVISSRRVATEPVLSLTIENRCSPGERNAYTLVLPSLEPSPAPARPARTAAQTAGGPRPHLRVHADQESETWARREFDEPELHARGVRGGQDLPDGLREREQAVIAALQRTIAAEAVLIARIQALEARQAVLESHVRALGLIPAAGPALATAAAPASSPTAAPVPAPHQLQPQLPRPAAVDAGRHRLHVAANVVLGALLALALAAIALLLRTRRGAPAPVNVAPATPVAPSFTPAPAAEPRPVAAEPTTPPEPPAAAARNVPQPATPAATTAPPSANDVPPADAPQPLGLDAADEHKSAVELADIMVSFGRIHGAAATLAEYIKSNPKEAVTPWLKLLDLYHTAGLKTEFDNWARQLHKAFNIRRATWESYESMRNSTASVEDLPHITKRLQVLWGTPACKAYIEELLRDHRQGSREGFSFAVVDDLLMLEGVLEQELDELRNRTLNGDAH